jgi:hypothetical protein
MEPYKAFIFYLVSGAHVFLNHIENDRVRIIIEYELCGIVETSAITYGSTDCL